MAKRRRGVLVFLAGAAVVAGGAGPLAVGSTAGAWAAPAGAVRAASVPGNAIGVPGLGVLNQGGNSQVVSVSCTSASNCLGGGYYKDRQRHLQGFVATEKNGRWGRAAEVPGLGALNKGGHAAVWSVSCTLAGKCAAAGDYLASGREHDFVAVEKNGQWGRAAEVPGLGALNKGGTNEAEVWVSCGSAGNCSVAGNYTDGAGHQQGYVASEKNGVWSPAIEVPGLAALNVGGHASVWSLSCGATGNCAVAGDFYIDGDGHRQGFVADEEKGVWGPAIEMPGLAALNQGNEASVRALSCASAGNCTAGGFYTDNAFAQQAFVATEKNGVWDPATGVPALEAANNRTDQPMAFVNSVSCATPGNCLAGGAYGGPYSGAFTATETNGVWGQATTVPGLSDIVTGRWAYVGRVSCASPGNCAAVGDYELVPGGSTGVFEAFQRNGQWGNAIHVPGLRALNKGKGSNISSVSCGSSGHCTVAGNYTDGHRHGQGFVS